MTRSYPYPSSFAVSFRTQVKNKQLTKFVKINEKNKNAISGSSEFNKYLYTTTIFQNNVGNTVRYLIHHATFLYGLLNKEII